MRDVVDVNGVENRVVWSAEVDGIKIRGFTVIFEECAVTTIGTILCNKNVASDLERVPVHRGYFPLRSSQMTTAIPQMRVLETIMRGDDQQLQSGMFSYVAMEDRIPSDHPLRGVRKLVDAVLGRMTKEFDGLYSEVGRPSIAPERLLRALLLQVFYSVRSERLLMEQLNYNLLFRWFVGLEIDEEVWNHAVFSKNRDRLLNQDLAQKFFAHVKEQAAGLMSDEHFTVDGTLIEAWAGQKSFRRKDEDDGPKGRGDFRGEPGAPGLALFETWDSTTASTLGFRLTAPQFCSPKTVHDACPVNLTKSRRRNPD
jgi:transposase